MPKSVFVFIFADDVGYADLGGSTLSLLRKLCRFMPAGPVDAGLRKTFGLG